MDKMKRNTVTLLVSVLALCLLSNVVFVSISILQQNRGGMCTITPLEQNLFFTIEIIHVLYNMIFYIANLDDDALRK